MLQKLFDTLHHFTLAVVDFCKKFAYAYTKVLVDDYNFTPSFAKAVLFAETLFLLPLFLAFVLQSFAVFI